MREIRIAVVGAGNCAWSLIQGLAFYAGRKEKEMNGMMHKFVGGYTVDDIRLVAMFDVDRLKVGKDAYRALETKPNNTLIFQPLRGKSGVKVLRGHTLDGLGEFYQQTVLESKAKPVDIAKELKRTKAHVLINYLPVGSEHAAKFYAQEAIKAGCGFINAMPVFIASDPEWEKKFKDARLPIIGDDIKSQVGATIVHRMLTSLFGDRGVKIHRTYQINFGGNMDFMNMLERSRLKSKKISKTQAVTSVLKQKLAPENIHVGPSDYIPWLKDRKWCHIRMEGENFGGAPLHLELKLEVWDSPNSAGVMMDAIRCIKLALDRGKSGALLSPSSYYMKSPPVQDTDDAAKRHLDNFIRDTEGV